ncbi:hypothetical protein ACIOFV_07485 [Streptomyces mirabilis]|jgi:hypothetical protein|uniref:hypothetical protein n=1 Tax=Streptomyces mirabilis TaxID=68239 RepID=UPI0035E369A2
MTIVRRLLAGASVSTTIVAGLVATAPAAQASASSCTNYLAGKGYVVGTSVKKACRIGESGGGPSDWGMCVQLLVDIGVRASHAEEACNRA